MDAIRLRQIEEVMGYDKHINVMVMDMERKRVSQTIREKPEDTYALIDSQKMLDVIDATNSLRLMLDGKLASLSAILRPSNNVDAGAAQDVWQVEAVVSKYNEISAPFVSANGATSLQQNIMRQALELLKPIGAIKNGAHKVLNGIVSMIGARRSGPDDPLFSNPNVLLRSAGRDACHLRDALRAPQIVQAAADNAQRSHDAGLGPDQ